MAMAAKLGKLHCTSPGFDRAESIVTRAHGGADDGGGGEGGAATPGAQKMFCHRQSPWSLAAGPPLFSIPVKVKTGSFYVADAFKGKKRRLRAATRQRGQALQDSGSPHEEASVPAGRLDRGAPQGAGTVRLSRR